MTPDRMTYKASLIISCALNWPKAAGKGDHSHGKAEVKKMLVPSPAVVRPTQVNGACT
jgi:hypothetical protein